MDTNAYLILGLSGLLLLNAVLRLVGGSSRDFNPARLERKLDLLLAKFEINPVAEVGPEVVELARAGQKIRAIKQYRRQTGSSLREAKDVIDRL